MNLNFINREFERLAILEDCIDYQFEPKAKNIGGKRNIYYDDLKLDFIDEVNTFGFSPFILQGFEKQRKNPNIMQYMTKKFNHGLTNYVRRQNQAVRYKKDKEVIEKKKNEMKIIEHDSIHLKRKEPVKVAKKEIFLQKALENLALDKLNISTDEDHMFEENIDDEISADNNGKKGEKTEEIYTKIVEANKKRIMEQLREKYFKSVQNQTENVLPKVTMTDFEKPTALKVNFENLFLKKNKGGESGKYKKIVALSKNKEYLFSGGVNNKNNMLKTEGNWNKNEDGSQRTGLKTLSSTINNTVNKKRVKFKTMGPQCTTATSDKSRTVTLPYSNNNTSKENFLLISRAKRFKDFNPVNKPLTTTESINIIFPYSN